MKIRIVAKTDVGKERDNNEDAYLFCSDLTRQDWQQTVTPSYIPLGKYGALVAVADGMGGANAGEVASAMAMDAVKAVFQKASLEDYATADKAGDLLRLCVSNGDQAISERTVFDSETSGMGTTIVICWLLGDTVHVAWCGDSRCYAYHPLKGLRPLTKDHSYVQELVDKGEIVAEEAYLHPDSNLITRALGDDSCSNEPDVISSRLEPGELLLLCSDGLCGYCPDESIEQVLRAHYTDAEQCCDQLLSLALDAGGYDNICIAVVSLIGDDQEAPVAISPVQRFWYTVRKVLHI
jgi:protein phosphatase